MSFVDILLIVIMVVGVTFTLFKAWQTKTFALRFSYQGFDVRVKRGAMSAAKLKSFRDRWIEFAEKEFSRLEPFTTLSMREVLAIGGDSKYRWTYELGQTVKREDGTVAHNVISTPWAKNYGYTSVNSMTDWIGRWARVTTVNALTSGTDGHEMRLALCGLLWNWDPSAGYERQMVLTMRVRGIYQYTGFKGVPFSNKELSTGEVD